MRWLTFARLNNPSYPSLIRRFYANLCRHKQRLYLVATIGNIDIELEPSSMCRILGVNNEGDEVYDTNNWLILSNFDPQGALKRLCKLSSWHPKSKSKDLTLQARLLLLFVQHNILPQGGHRSEPSYLDLWLVDSILCGSKVNLGFLIVQHMTNVLFSASHMVFFSPPYSITSP